MKHTSSIIPVIIILLFILPQCSSREISREKNTLKPFEKVSLKELTEMIETGNITKTQVNIRGFVKQKFICPPCPDGYDCEQCPPDHIIVSDGGISITIDCRPERFMKDEEYCFSLERKKYTDGFPYNITGWENKPGKQCRPGNQNIDQ